MSMLSKPEKDEILSGIIDHLELEEATPDDLFNGIVLAWAVHMWAVREAKLPGYRQWWTENAMIGDPPHHEWLDKICEIIQLGDSEDDQSED